MEDTTLITCWWVLISAAFVLGIAFDIFKPEDTGELPAIPSRQ